MSDDESSERSSELRKRSLVEEMSHFDRDMKVMSIEHSQEQQHRNARLGRSPSEYKTIGLFGLGALFLCVTYLFVGSGKGQPCMRRSGSHPNLSFHSLTLCCIHFSPQETTMSQILIVN